MERVPARPDGRFFIRARPEAPLTRTAALIRPPVRRCAPPRLITEREAPGVDASFGPSKEGRARSFIVRERAGAEVGRSSVFGPDRVVKRDYIPQRGRVVGNEVFKNARVLRSPWVEVLIV